ncbi:MFS transporter [Gordonia insulae]|uniref:Antiseptic resistance protein n=1 Tax=Gordonia insulae TaxID=2420509 RepID=A0A3G8JHK4_9ACTN|nr:MFS transporter [Gordonia insulae]AZG44566.1 Antiseptic resistance protein [Gordonia insulae]
MTTRQHAPASEPTARHGLITLVVCLALATVVAAMSSLNVALPDIARSTHATQTQLEWVIDAYSLVFASLLLPAGALGDRFGRRRALIAGLVIFGLGSAVAMTAGSPTELIALRCVLGLGAAFVMPATLSTITATFPPAQRTKAVSIWAGVAGASAILGVLCTGVLLEFWSWRSAFALNVVLAVIALVAVLRFVPESVGKKVARLDVGGALLSVAGLVVLVYSIIEAPEVGWAAGRTLAGIACGLAILAGFVVWELRHRSPLLDPRVFTKRALAAGSLSIFVQFFAFFGFIFVVLQYLQLVRGDSALVAGLSMLPMAATLMPFARLAPVVVERIGTRAVCVTGLLLIAAGMVVLAQLDAHSSYWLLLGGLLPLGAGMGWAMTPATSAITGALPPAQQGVASALNDLSREVGGAFGIAVIGSVLTSTYRSSLELPAQVPAAVDAMARDSFALASHLGGRIADTADTAFVTGLHHAILAGAGASVLAAIVVAILLRQRTTTGHDDDTVGDRTSIPSRTAALED